MELRGLGPIPHPPPGMERKLHTMGTLKRRTVPLAGNVFSHNLPPAKGTVPFKGLRTMAVLSRLQKGKVLHDSK
jgi:hypothetical protein